MPKPPPPRIPQLGEVRFGTRPNPFSKAQLIESQLAKIDIAQAELFRNLKLNPPATAPRPLPQSETCLPENQEPMGETAGPKLPQPGLRRLKSTPHAAGSPDNKAQPLNPGPQAHDLDPAGEKPEILETGKTIPEHSSQQVIPLPPSRRKRSTANSRSSDKEAEEPAGNAPPHYEGHRERLRNRFLKGGIEGLADYELLELILFRAMPRRDLKPLAKDLIAKFGSFAQVIAARPERLQETPGLGTAAITEIKIIEAAARRLAKSNIEKRPSMGSFSAVVDYCRTAMAFLDHEEFRVLFLDKKNFLIADEVQGIGTVDHAPVYTREIIRRALELSASAIILVHNHPSGDPQPSTEDIYLTHQIIDIAKKLNVAVHDHLIIGKHGHASLKGMRII